MSSSASTPGTSGLSLSGKHSAASKLRPPQPLPFEIMRTEVCDRICSDATRVVLIRAPAGFGKTTTMLQVKTRLEERGIPGSWLTADASDNDIGRFLVFLSSAFARLVTGGGQRAVIHPGEGADAGGLPALDLLDRVADCETPFALFIDDFETIENLAVLVVVQQLAECLPEGSRLVIGSRHLPDIGLAALRARGQLLEIKPADLRFSVPETREFMKGQRGTALREVDIASLHRRTEGWPVALRLASVALERHGEPQDFVARFSGSNTMLAEYLGQEVLARQPQELRDFLLRTSILRELSTPLCNAVCSCSDSGELLARIAGANLFLVPLDDEGQLYRYHSVMADFLRAQLQRSLPAEVPGLHRMASQWYQAQQRPVPAIDHALASGDLQYALPILGQHAGRLLEEGRVRLLTRWLDAIPASQLQANPKLRIVHAWALSFTRGAREAMRVLDEVEATPGRSPDVDADALALRVNLLTMNDRPEDAHAAAARDATVAQAAGSFSLGVTRNALAHVAIVQGHYAEARRLLGEARRTEDGHAGPFNLLYSDLMEAVIDLIQGRLRQATVRCRVAAGSAAGARIGNTHGKALVAILLAEMLYEANDLEQAERLLSLYLPLMQECALPELFIPGHRVLARIAAERGDLDHARQLMAELEHLGHRTGLARAVASAKLERSRLALLKGDLGLAGEELKQSNEVVDWERIHRWSTTANEVDSYPIGRLRWLIHSGAADKAVPKLKQELELAENQLRHRRALKLKILLALALDRTAHGNAAMRVLRDALYFASGEGFVRSFLDEGPAVLELLRRFGETTLAEGVESESSIASKAYLERLLQADQEPQPVALGVAAGSHAPLASSITRKELWVLEKVAEGLSNDEIARKLFVSESTVRTHLRKIHAKLGVRNRTQAIAVARKLQLLR